MKPAPAKNIDDDLTHHEIGLTRDAYVLVDDEPVIANIHRFAGQIHDWMQQKGFVNFYLESDKKNYPHIYTNPFTFHTSTLAQIWQAVINEANDFAEGRIVMDSNDAEIKFTRLRSELLIMGCRLVEAIIKQLLHCTGFSKKDYVKAAIGSLIAYDCKSCRNAGKKTHKISMLGSVGHRYGLCQGYEECVNEHIRKLAKWRNDESSHASTQPFKGLSSSQAKQGNERSSSSHWKPCPSHS